MNARKFMYDLVKPGETIILGGKKGGGKTATSISIAQHCMDGDYGHENVVVITNVLFGRARGHGKLPLQAYPPGIYHEDTLSGTMRRIGEVIREYGSGNSTIIWLLDEAQNYMMADQNGSKENLALTKYLGNARKFDVCNFFLSPAINNLTPRVRCFPTGESKSGYCSAQMIKDPARAKELVGKRADPRSITFVKAAVDEPFVPVFIQPTPWIRSIYESGLPEGTYGYDTKSTATFSVGENGNGVPFSFEAFIKATSGGLSHELPDKIESFFDKWDSQGSDSETALPGEDYTKIRISEQCRRIGRMRDLGLTWRDIATIEGEIQTTVQSRFYKYSGYPSSRTRGARDSTIDETDGGRAGPDIYNPNRGGCPGDPAPSEGGDLR